ncbi:hypothetical protein DFH08DRAFT_903377 [Mycena albidolilacea]|uniref:Uncharacterized protein n=1 Tax=Mycena albidolilacea TaxID=1033008 RepID=A0AAD6Z2F4_9AGAR|nr:hypothetical protein DFH08DRAFT_903377 [Mycena albidolilacea]
MQLSVFVVLSAALTAMASPTGGHFRAREASPPAHVDGNVQVCTDVNSAGVCRVFPFANGECISFDKHGAFNDKVSTFNPDINVQCIVFKDGDCLGTTLNINFPGADDLTPLNFNDEMTSFRCNSVGSKAP